MDILETMKTVGSASCDDLDAAIAALNEEAEALVKSIVENCAAGEFDCAWDSTAQYDKVKAMTDLLCSLRNQLFENKE